MSEMRIPEGEAVEIVAAVQSRQKFNYRHIDGGEIWLDHNPRSVTTAPARKTTAGDEGTISKFRGSGVYAYAPDEAASLRVTAEGFLLDLFGIKDSERPDDRVARTGSRETTRTGTTVSSGSSNTFTLMNNSGEAPKAVDAGGLSVYCNGSGTGNTATQDVRFLVQVKDAGSNIVEEYAGNGPTYTVLKNIHVPRDGLINIDCKNFSGSEVGFGAAVTYRDANL